MGQITVKAAATLKALKRLVLLEPNETEAQQYTIFTVITGDGKMSTLPKGKP